MNVGTPRVAPPFVAMLCLLAGTVMGGAAQVGSPTSFADLVTRLSEPGGYFGGDNLISNEQSYLRVMDALDASGLQGGAYIGVGPDQNYSYIAAVAPDVAFMLDIRRDNLLLHLLFKALSGLAPTRQQYLHALLGRAPPAAGAVRSREPISDVVGRVERAPRLPESALTALGGRIDTALSRFGLALSVDDRRTIARFHRAFVDAGLGLVFQAYGRPAQPYYPTLRDLLFETDASGRTRSFLAADASYETIRLMHAEDRIVPVVGDVAGSRALGGIAVEMARRNLTLSAFYISNVEFYLWGDGTFGAFATNLAKLPRTPRSVVIRSVFPSGFPRRLPQWRPGHYSASLTQPLEVMLDDVQAGRYRSYFDLIQKSAR